MYELPGPPPIEEYYPSTEYMRKNQEIGESHSKLTTKSFHFLLVPSHPGE